MTKKNENIQNNKIQKDVWPTHYYICYILIIQQFKKNENIQNNKIQKDVWPTHYYICYILIIQQFRNSNGD